MRLSRAGVLALGVGTLLLAFWAADRVSPAASVWPRQRCRAGYGHQQPKALPPHRASTNQRDVVIDLRLITNGRLAKGTRVPSLYSILRAAKTMHARR